MEEHLFRGVYSADRAAALSGVPRSTLYYWARHSIWKPTLRESRPKLWTYADVLALRIIYWLRHPTGRREGTSTSMQEIRLALQTLRASASRLGSPEVRVFVDRDGHLFFATGPDAWRATRPGQTVISPILDVLAEFKSEGARLGPDLVTPRPHLRIIPGKLSGEPHVEGTRISSRSVAALLRDGLTPSQVLELYPDLSDEAVEECWDLELQLQVNLAA